ncbi:MAG: prepilin-type N-terminal cleavage/methylation domain-containing protein [Verrucomicrobiota bacterium]
MLRRPPHSIPGFTLLELCIAIAIVVLLLGVALPSLSGVLNQSKDTSRFASFDQMVQQAHTRSLTERRPYVLVWTQKNVVLRPDEISEKGAPAAVQQWNIDKDESVVLDLPAALIKRPEAVWTFWPSGVCEPASVFYKSKAAKWKATYNPFTAQAEVKHE